MNGAHDSFHKSTAHWPLIIIIITIIIMYIYHAIIIALSAHLIHINLNIIFYTHVEHSPTKTSYIKYYIYIKKEVIIIVISTEPFLQALGS